MNKLKKSIFKSRLFLLRQIKLEDNIDITRRQNILNILLTSFLIVAVIAQVLVIISALINSGNNLNFTLIPTFAGVFFLILLRLSRANKVKISAFLFLSLLFMLIFKASTEAGVDNPQTIVIYSLIITMSGILLGPKFSLISTGTICIALYILFWLHQNNIISYSRDWKTEVFGVVDVLVLLTSYMVIAIVSWLFSREITNSLKRVKKSENEALDLAKELQKEKDNLEIKVEERTKELRESQLRELTRVNSLAEFGKLSAGLLHDIKNPLTVISLNLDSLRDSPKSKTIELINRSLLAAKTAETIIKSSQKQFVENEDKQDFDLAQEIKNTLILVEHMAEREHIQIVFSKLEKIFMNSYPAKFSRVIANLLMNAIDSFAGLEKENKKIEISLVNNKKEIIVEVKDNGCGIKEEDQLNIFQPLFSNKEDKDRMGLGLYGSKKIMKDYFGGDLMFESIYGSGTKFSVIIPKND